MIRIASAASVLRVPILYVTALLTCMAMFQAAAASEQPGSNDLARQVLKAAGVNGGVIVHLGCGDGRLTAALHAGDAYLVQGLDADAKSVEAARRRIRSLGLCDRVSAVQISGNRLPYVDNLINLVVADELGGVPMDEVMRVLAPLGVAYVKQGGQWTKTVKPWPEQIDEWTHFLHGADGNAVARDEVVGAPYHIQWIGSPTHSRNHQFTTSMDVMVSAGGRIFYIFDEGSTAIPYYLPSRWSLVARDAFNGVVLWKRPLAEWRPYLVHGRTSLAADMWRRLVAAKGEVYVTETIFGPVVALDAATGETLRKYQGTEKTEEIVCDAGVLYLVATASPIEDIDRRQLAVGRTAPDAKRVMAVEASTGAVLWTKEDDDTLGVHPLTLAVAGKRLFLQNTMEVLCLDAATAKPIWRYPRPSDYAMPGHTTPTLVVHDDVVLSAGRTGKQGRRDADTAKRAASELIALSAVDGRELWRCDCGENVGAGVDVFVAGGLAWVGENQGRAASDYNHGRDLHTGEILKTFDHADAWPTWHHHRCYRDKATEQFILAGRTGIEFVDLDSGELITNHWVRGVCEFGILPSNGLIYSPPDQCACYAESKLHGFHALAPKRATDDQGPAMIDVPRLEEGPAYQGKELEESQLPASTDWPTFRHDNLRSGFTRAETPRQPEPAWTTKLGGKLTTLVSAGGRVYVAQPQTHTVFCLDGETGNILWSYQAGGRVDSPPSISRGIAVFGSHDGWVYALHAADGELIWRFRAAPGNLQLVDDGQLASVWPVHGSVLIDDKCVYFAAGRNSCLDGGMYLYRLDLATGKTLLEKNYSSRDPKTGEYVKLFTPFDAELLPDRELPGLLPDVFSSDGENLYLRSVPLDRDLEIEDKHYVRHLFGSMGFLEDTWWERSYWIYGSHFYGGARGHGYARTLFPAGRLLTFDDESVYGYLDPAVDERTAGIFRVPKAPEFIDLGEELAGSGSRRGAKGRKAKAALAGEAIDEDSIRRTYVWKDGIPQNPEAMQLTRGTLGDAIRSITKYEYTWQQDPPLYPQAMLLTDDTLFIAGPPRFDEEATAERLSTSPTDRFPWEPLLQDAVDTFEGRKGGVLCAVDKKDGTQRADVQLPSSPVFDGLIAAGGKLFLALKDGSVVCLKSR
jgi:outer membrane protein assembly factor BamB